MPCSMEPEDSGFNPRVLAGGRDIASPPLQTAAGVSIHASSREDATRRIRRDFCLVVVSIHASSREDATSTGFSDSEALRFNPRVLAGGRDLACA